MLLCRSYVCSYIHMSKHTYVCTFIHIHICIYTDLAEHQLYGVVKLRNFYLICINLFICKRFIWRQCTAVPTYTYVHNIRLYVSMHYTLQRQCKTGIYFLTISQFVLYYATKFSFNKVFVDIEETRQSNKVSVQFLPLDTNFVQLLRCMHKFYVST